MTYIHVDQAPIYINIFKFTLLQFTVKFSWEVWSILVLTKNMLLVYVYMCLCPCLCVCTCICMCGLIIRDEPTRLHSNFI